MKKVIVVFCDIRGTIKGNVPNTDIDYKEFSINLSKLIEQDEAHEMIFSLISTDTSEYVSKEKHVLERYFDDSITFGKQFYENGYTLNDFPHIAENGKVNQINRYINEIKNRYQINKVYYIDDCRIFHDMLDIILEDRDFQVESIVPEDYLGLKEINSLINDQLIKNKVKIYL